MVSCIQCSRSASRTSQAVDEITPLNAGLMLLPYSLGSSLASMPVAWFLSYQQKRTSNTSGQKWAICVGLLVSTLGFGKTAFTLSSLIIVLRGARSIASTSTPHSNYYAVASAFDCRCWFRNVVPRTLPGVHLRIATRGSGNRDKCILSCSLYWRYGWTGTNLSQFARLNATAEATSSLLLEPCSRASSRADCPPCGTH